LILSYQRESQLISPKNMSLLHLLVRKNILIELTKKNFYILPKYQTWLKNYRRLQFAQSQPLICNEQPKKIKIKIMFRKWFDQSPICFEVDCSPPNNLKAVERLKAS
jgi:hypothetical protein